MNVRPPMLAGGARPRYLLVGLCMTAIVGCSRAPGQPSPGQAASAADNEFRSFSVTIVGYNYTDTGIGYFGAAYGPGGNVEVSTPAAGGSGSACCGSVSTPLGDHYKLPVRWTRDGQTYCRQDVPLRGPLPARPQYLEVHFYRDGHIELALAETPSPPRLRLERHHPNARHADERLNIINDAAFSRCQLGDF